MVASGSPPTQEITHGGATSSTTGGEGRRPPEQNQGLVMYAGRVNVSRRGACTSDVHGGRERSFHAPKKVFEELYRENVMPRNSAAVICAMRPLARRINETAARFGAIKLFVANLHSRARVTTHFPSFILLNLTMNKGQSSEKTIKNSW